jgi:small-conductance mechanosensitive channel
MRLPLSRLAALPALIVSFWLMVGAALSQTAPELPDFEQWQLIAERAEEVVERAAASTDALEALRAQLAAWRERLLAAQRQNTTRIQTLEAQLGALGPPPEEGETEPEDIAQRRAELQQQLETLRAPIRNAEAAFTRAQGLITEIDAIIRARQVDALLSLGATPLNPANWALALGEVAQAARAMELEVVTAIATPSRLAEARNRLPGIVLLLATGFVLLLRGHRWVERAGAEMRARSRRGTGVWSLLISVGHILLPLAGITAITTAAAYSGLAGPRLSRMLAFLPVAFALLLGYRWLGQRLYSSVESEAVIPLAEGRRREARLYSNLLAVLLVLQISIGAFVALGNLSQATEAVMQFWVTVLIGLVLFRLGTILARYRGASEDTESAFLTRAIRFLGRASVVFAVLAPLLAAVGYLNASLLIRPWIVSLAILGLVLILQRFVRDLDQLVTGRETAGEGLIPVLVGMVLTIAALPFLALVWGMRVADLTEIWARFREGFMLGETRVSPTDFLVFILIFVLGYLATRALQGGLRNSLLPRTTLDKGAQNAIISGVGYVGIFLAALIAISAAGINLSSLAIVAGALSVGIGFGLQNIVQNFVSGIILLIERPVSEGDWIEVGGQMGIVRKISVRSTRIETFDRTDVIVPNGDFVSGVVTNWTRGNTIGRVIVPVGVAYGTDTRKVERILQEVAEDHPMVLMQPPPSVFFRGFGADSLDFEIRAILRDVNWVLSVQSEMNHAIAKRFAEEGIEIPFAQRDVWLRNPETLLNKSAPAAASGSGTSEPAPPPRAPDPFLDRPENETDGEADGR